MALIGYDPRKQADAAAARRPTKLTAPPLEQTVMITRSDVPKAPPVRALWLIPLVGGGLSRAFIIREAETVLGRQMGAGVRLWDSKVSRQHCKILLTEHAAVVVDLDSSNGTFVNDEQIERAELKDGDLLRVGDTVFRIRYMDFGEQTASDDAYWLATRDPGTELYNRQYMLEALQRECARAAHHGYPLALLLLGVEPHEAPQSSRLASLDKEARALAALLRQQGNEDLILGRYSTAELIAILPMTAPDAAQSLADKVQAEFQAASGDAAPRRLAVGLAHFPDQADSAEQLLEKAEIMLYQARTPAPPEAG
ncbi:MAG: hypothetical protein Kow00123_20500 [Anaerolineales bacterium]